MSARRRRNAASASPTTITLGTQYPCEICKGQTNLSFKVRLGRAIATTTHLARYDYKVIRADGRRISMPFV